MGVRQQPHLVHGAPIEHLHDETAGRDRVNGMWSQGFRWKVGGVVGHSR